MVIEDLLIHGTDRGAREPIGGLEPSLEMKLDDR